MKFGKCLVALMLGASAISIQASNTRQPIADKTILVPINGSVDGKTLDEYANRWWQWAKTLPPNANAINDENGEYCGVNQMGDVWFLAGGYGNSLIRRTCTISGAKHLFFPIINMGYWQNLRAEKQASCESVKHGAALNNEHLLSISATLNGKIIENAGSFRIKSKECFDIYGLIDEKYDAPKWYPAATDGYWLMLKPLSPGVHKLKFQAQYFRENGAFGRMAQDIEYTLIIE